MLRSLHCRNHTLKLDHTLIMGVLNVTPDSFSDGGLFLEPEKAVAHAQQMVKEGADIIDVGGESSKPGSERVTEEEELKRITEIVERLVKEVNVPISIDTYKSGVAEACMKLGAHMLNDISGLSDVHMGKVAQAYGVPLILMHMQGTPKTMQANPTYGDVVVEVKDFLKERIEKAKREGVSEIIIDPGIGFGKSITHNLQILKRLNELSELNCPILVGPSRKSFIGTIAGLPVHERLEGTLSAVSIAIMNGANIVRVHDVHACKRAARIADAIKKGEFFLSNNQ